ncbi:hypothetical protein NE237_011219 [Protea cynaroides]|uniref:Uncharacterized protein n=1 Tax=Protea cynaroides TaxID=273540 RepID=A0A9Q0JWK4_9MAGN|nr:hypothetical protein NE237_011219 [Protea cynaroides]
MELFTLAISNSLIIFGLCNLIIVILLLSNSKPSSPGPQESFICTHKVPKRIEEEKRGHEASLSVNVPQVKNAEKFPVDRIGESENEDEYEEEEEDDELRKRVEEFIDKIIRGWKAEKLMTSHHIRNPIC